MYIKFKVGKWVQLTKALNPVYSSTHSFAADF